MVEPRMSQPPGSVTEEFLRRASAAENSAGRTSGFPVGKVKASTGFSAGLPAVVWAGGFSLGWPSLSFHGQSRAALPVARRAPEPRKRPVALVALAVAEPTERAEDETVSETLRERLAVEEPMEWETLLMVPHPGSRQTAARQAAVGDGNRFVGRQFCRDGRGSANAKRGRFVGGRASKNRV